MDSRNLAARGSALLQQNDALNAAASKAQDEARTALRSLSKATVPVVPLSSVGAPGDAARVSSRAMSKAAVHVNALGSPTERESPRDAPSDGFQRSPSKMHLDGSTSPDAGRQQSKRNQSISGVDRKTSGSRKDMLQSQRGSATGLNKSSHSLAVDEARREQAATLQHLEDQIASVTDTNKATERATAKMIDQMDQMKADHVALVRKLEQIDVQLAKQKTTQATLEVNYKATEGELANAHTTLDEARRHEKHAAQSAKAVQIRLDRVMADVEKVQNELKDLKEQKGGAAVPRVDFERVGKEVTTLEKQKVELVTLYKKQSKLIDILKRQKLHLEAAKNIAFTEDEFRKTLDWGV